MGKIVTLRGKWDDGRRFEEVDGIGCTGKRDAAPCAADLNSVDADDIMLCFKLPECRSKYRADGRDVVYKLVEVSTC